MGRTLKQVMAGLPPGRRVRIKARGKELAAEEKSRAKKGELYLFKKNEAGRKVTSKPKGLAEADDRTARVVLPALRDAIAAIPGVKRIVLFGSRAKGDAEARSDIDIAVSCPAASTRVWLDICWVAEEAETLLKIDLVRLEDASPAFRRRIQREGKVLYERR